MSHYKRVGMGLLCLLFLGLDFPKFKTGEESALQNFQKGVIHFNSREYSLARENFYSVLSKKTDFPLAKFFLFQSYYQSGDWLLAGEILSELLNELPQNSVIRNRYEALEMELSGRKNPSSDRVFYKSIQGEENRGYRFRNPVDTFQDDVGNLYVLGFQTTNLVSFYPNWEPRWITQGGFFQKMKGPISLLPWDDKIIVVDYPSDSLFLFDKQGRFLDRMGESGSGLSQFRGPTGVTRDDKGNFYISDAGNHRIIKWNKLFEPLFSFGDKGEKKLRNPVNITWNDGYLYVVDNYLSQIVIYDEEGNFIKEISSPLFKKIRNIKFLSNRIYITSEEKGILYAESISDEWKRLPPFKDEKGRFRNIDRPFGVSIDKYGYFYATDYNRHRVDIFAPKNYLLTNLSLDIDRIDTSQFPDIHLYFRIKNRTGQPITGLKRNDFLLEENQNDKKYFDSTDMKKFNERMTLSFVYENSPELIDDADVIRTWMEPFFRRITYNDNLELLRSSENVTTILNKSHSLHDIFFQIRRSRPSSSVNSGKAIYQAIGNLSKSLGPRSVIYFASGKYPVFTKQFSLPKIIQFAKAHEIRILPVLVQKPHEEDDSWQTLAEETGGKLFYISDNSMELYDTAYDNKDNRYVISFKTEALPSLSGRWIPLELRVNYRDFGGKITGGYFVP